MLTTPEICRTTGLDRRTLHELARLGLRPHSRRAGEPGHPRWSPVDTRALAAYRLLRSRHIPRGVAAACAADLIRLHEHGPGEPHPGGCIRWNGCPTSWSWCPAGAPLAAEVADLVLAADVWREAARALEGGTE